MPVAVNNENLSLRLMAGMLRRTEENDLFGFSPVITRGMTPATKLAVTLAPLSPSPVQSRRCRTRGCNIQRARRLSSSPDQVR
jgi:hypothetical protein